MRQGGGLNRHAGQPAQSDIGSSKDGVTYANGAPPKALVPAHSAHVGYGFLTVAVEAHKITLVYTLVQGNHRQPFETATVQF